MKRVWHTAQLMFAMATGMALLALLREEQGALERKDEELVERLRRLGAA